MPDLQRRRPDPAAPHARLLIIGRISSSSLTRSISPSPPFDQIAALNGNLPVASIAFSSFLLFLNILGRKGRQHALHLIIPFCFLFFLCKDAWMLPRFNILSIKTHGSSVDSFSYYLFSFLFHRAIVLATVYSIFAV
ncbi:hypothetical protein SEVIR_5G291401v4 [Setaria viridis]|uniref:Uncharacterized protein n=1 Tax=Setaria viridis TaxID=4556 RepID=A0A4V6D6Z1_SETVI|nr:hypothetical protein SEVIR_5G291401v2 [Setaria viridis]